MASARHGSARVVHVLGNEGMTGVETFVLTLAAAQKEGGGAPAIACELVGRDELLRTSERVGIAVQPLRPPWTPRQSGGRSPLHRAARVAELAAHLRRADVAHVHAVGIAGFEALVAARLTGTPVVVTHHATLRWFAPFRSRLSDATFWLEKRVAARVVLPYREAAREMEEHGIEPARLAVVPFCVDLAKFDHAPKAHRAASREVTMIMVARFVEGKGHAELVEAFARLAKTHPELRLALLGDGPTWAAIDARVRELGLDERVFRPGHLANELVPERVRAADVIVLPSYMPGETFPLSLLEGMAMGLPAIGTRWFGIPDIVDDGVTGLVVPPGDVEALTEAMRTLASSAELRASFGAAGLVRARASFSAEAVAEAYARIYAEAVR